MKMKAIVSGARMVILNAFRFLYENAFIICIAHGIGILNYLLLMNVGHLSAQGYWNRVFESGYLKYLLPIWGVLCIMALIRDSFHSDKGLKNG